jgi:hypothetical protein
MEVVLLRETSLQAVAQPRPPVVAAQQAAEALKPLR